MTTIAYAYGDGGYTITPGSDVFTSLQVMYDLLSKAFIKTEGVDFGVETLTFSHANSVPGRMRCVTIFVTTGQGYGVRGLSSGNRLCRMPSDL